MKELIQYLKEAGLTEGQIFEAIQKWPGTSLPFGMTIKEASKLTGIGERKMREISNRRDFPKIINGTKVIVVTSELQTWLRNNINKTI